MKQFTEEITGKLFQGSREQGVDTEGYSYEAKAEPIMCFSDVFSCSETEFSLLKHLINCSSMPAGVWRGCIPQRASQL